VLLVVAQGVNGPERAGLLVAQGEVFPTEVEAALEADRAAIPLVEDFRSDLYQTCLQQHLERMLEVQQDGRGSPIVIEVVE
jgi:hypothetical protein